MCIYTYGQKKGTTLFFLSLRPCFEIPTFGTLLLLLFNVLRICKCFQFYCKWIINDALSVLKTHMQNQKSHKGKQPKNTLGLGWAELILFITK